MTDSFFARKTILFLIAFIILAGAVYFWPNGQANLQNKYKTQEVDRGNIIQAISANGTLSPVVLVNVGTQVSGTVTRLHADFNDHIQSGQILAELDPSLFQAQVAQDQANLMSAQSSLKLAKIKEQRSRVLFDKGFVSATDIDQAKQTLEAAQAQVAMAQAQLTRNRTNLRYTIIRSPISGVVVARNVDLGQTVAASFQTPTLFQIAQDLRQMQIDTSIAEADVGAISIGQAVKFTVDAFSDQNFSGTVKQIRLNPAIQQNVVTYNVVVRVDNADGKLLPGMTAHVHININQRTDVLRIPNAALRFKPKSDEEPRASRKKQRGTMVYLLDKDQNLRPVPVKAGITDNTFTEVLGGEIKAGDKLVTRELATDKKKEGNFKLRAF